MITLKKDNVVKVVATEEEAAKLKEKGFVVTTSDRDDGVDSGTAGAAVSGKEDGVNGGEAGAAAASGNKGGGSGGSAGKNSGGGNK